MRYIIDFNGAELYAKVLSEALNKAKLIYNETGIKPTITDTLCKEKIEY